MTDLISRADAMGAVQDHFNANGFKGYDDGQKMMDRIKALPSAELVLKTPQTYGKSINPSNAEVVEDYISRADAIELLTKIVFDEPPYLDSESLCRIYAKEQINTLPSAEQVTSKLKNPCDSLLTEESNGSKEHKSKLESADAVHGWIPCSERLPSENTEVLISLEWGIDIGEYRDGNWHSEWINHYDDDDVLAWMPLPKPYREDGEV